MSKMFAAAYAGFIAAALSALYLYTWQWQTDLFQSAYFFGVALMAVSALANILYWYGFALVGTKHRNATLHYMALLALGLSIVTDASGFVFTLLPSYAASSLWDGFDFVMSAIYAVAYIVTGLAVQRMRTTFGDTALWYGIFSMLSGVILLAGDFGIPAITTFGIVLNTILYALGGMILLQAARR